MIKKLKLIVFCLLIFSCSDSGDSGSNIDDSSGNNTNSPDSPHVPSGFDLVVIDDFNSFDNKNGLKV